VSFSNSKRKGYRIGNPNRVRHRGRRKGVKGTGCLSVLLILAAALGIASGYLLLVDAILHS
jgi:hypothetical protein